MIELKRRLREALDRGPSGEATLNRLLDQNDSDPRADLRTLLDLADTYRLRVLRRRLYDGDVIAHCFHREACGRTQGCVLFWVTGATSIAEVLAWSYLSEETLKAVCRSMRDWDSGALGIDTVFEVLETVLWERDHPEMSGRLAPADLFAVGAVDD